MMRERGNENDRSLLFLNFAPSLRQNRLCFNSQRGQESSTSVEHGRAEQIMMQIKISSEPIWLLPLPAMTLIRRHITPVMQDIVI